MHLSVNQLQYLIAVKIKVSLLNQTSSRNKIIHRYNYKLASCAIDIYLTS